VPESATPARRPGADATVSLLRADSALTRSFVEPPRERTARPGDEHRAVQNRSRPSPPAEWIQHQIERKGLRPRYAAYLIIAVWTVAIVVFGVIQHFVDEETFGTVWLGMWWAMQTVTTVGYGDAVPTDTVGMLLASVLMVGGLSLLAVVTGTITSAFVARAQFERRAAKQDPVMQELERVSAELREIKATLSRRSGGGGSA
jgi:voltage-gated potassium channel